MERLLLTALLGLAACGADGASNSDATPECVTSSECSSTDEPICETSQGQCRACTAGATGDTECMTKDAAAPICESGSCVECRTSADCTADANEPRCDTETGQCVGCVENSDCASEVCETSSGQCANAADVVYVATDGTDGAACGTQASRCLTIGGAQGGLDKVTTSRKTIKLSEGIYPEDVNVSGVTVDILGPATVNPPNDSSSFNVNTGSVVTLKEMTMSLAAGGAAADGVVCSSATLNIDQSTISQNAATGVQADNCTLTIYRSTISQNLAGGLDIDATSFDIQNNFIVANGSPGGGGSSIGGARFATAQASDLFAFNTVADSFVSSAGVNGAAMQCSAAPITATNNILYLTTGGNSVVDNCALTYSNVEGGSPGTGNIDDDPLFINIGAGNFHLQAGSPCIDMADPAANLTIDFDGDRRPQGAHHDIGADEVTQ